MLTNLVNAAQTLFAISLVMTAQILLVLLLRKPARAWLGAVAAYRLWFLVVLWLPLYAVGSQFIHWLATLNARGLNPDALKPAVSINDFLGSLSLFQFEQVAAGTAGASTSTLSYFWLALALLWLTGTCGVVVWQSYKWLSFSRYVKETALPVASSVLPATPWEDVARGKISVLSLRGMNSAAVFGIRQPVLLLPETFCQQHDEDQQYIILAHEAVHLRRKDNLWNLCAGLLLAVFWMNPLMFLAWRCFRFDQELSCDALALDACNQTQQKRYARTLLDSIALLPGIGPQPSLSAWDNLPDLKERIVMITQHLKTKARPAAAQYSLVVIALVGAWLTVFVSGVVSPVALAADAPPSNTAQTNQATPVSSARSGYSASVQKLIGDTLKLFNERKYEEIVAASSELQKSIASGTLSDYEDRSARQIIYQTYAMMKNFPQARVALEQLLKNKSLSENERSDLQYQSAQIFVQSENYEKAIPALLQWLETAKNPPASAYYLLAVCYYQVKQNAQALAYVEKVVTLNKEQPVREQLQLLAILYTANNKPAEAKAVQDELAKKFPSEKVNGEVKGLAPLTMVRPNYPAVALAEHVVGKVKVKFTIDEKGDVADPSVIESCAGPAGTECVKNDTFDQSALRAIAKWHYRPKIEDGIAVKREGIETTLNFQFEN